MAQPSPDWAFLAGWVARQMHAADPEFRTICCANCGVLMAEPKLDRHGRYEVNLRRCNCPDTPDCEPSDGRRR